MSHVPFPLYKTPFLNNDEDNCNSDLDSAEILEDYNTLNHLVNDAQIIINESSEFFEDNYEEVEHLEPLYPVAPEMTFTNWKKLDEYVF